MPGRYLKSVWRAAPLPRRSGALHPNAQVRLVVQCLEHDAVALGQLQELIDLLPGSIGVHLKGEADGLEADGRCLVDAERAAEIEIALGLHGSAAQRNLESRRDRL